MFFIDYLIRNYRITKKIRKNLFYLFDKYEERFAKTDLPHFIASAREEVECGEEGLAFEDFCSNLHEFDITISKDDFALIKECAELMQIEVKSWDFLEEQIKSY